MPPRVVRGVILDLCAGTGAWSEPYLEAGYDVHRFDLPTDVRLLERRDVMVHGILAAPPCDKFARVGARWKRTEADMRDALSIVDACLRAVFVYRPTWWALENPVGKLARYLGPPVFKFDPCDFGDPWTKRTWLWGMFKPPIFALPVAPVYPAHRPARSRDRTSMLSGSNRRERARTSAAFARAFFEANP
jgi:hypothetical protein